MTPLGTPGRRVAIVAGVRTPFARSGTLLADYSALDLGRHAVAALMQRTELDGMSPPEYANMVRSEVNKLMAAANASKG